MKIEKYYPNEFRKDFFKYVIVDAEGNKALDFEGKEMYFEEWQLKQAEQVLASIKKVKILNENHMNKYISKYQAYLRKNRLDTLKKDNQIQVSKIVLSILKDRTPKQAIEFFLEIEKLFNSKLDENLKSSLEDVTEIGKFKNI